MLFNKKNNPDEKQRDVFSMAFSAVAGNALVKILRSEDTDFEKDKYSILSTVQHLPLVSEKAQKYYNDLLTIRERALDVEELTIAIEKYAMKDSETGDFNVTMTHKAFGNLITIVNQYKQKRMRDLLIIRDDQALGNDSFDDTTKRIEDLNRGLQYVVEAEKLINQYSSEL